MAIPPPWRWRALRASAFSTRPRRALRSGGESIPHLRDAAGTRRTRPPLGALQGSRCDRPAWPPGTRYLRGVVGRARAPERHVSRPGAGLRGRLGPWPAFGGSSSSSRASSPGLQPAFMIQQYVLLDWRRLLLLLPRGRTPARSRGRSAAQLLHQRHARARAPFSGRVVVPPHRLARPHPRAQVLHSSWSAGSVSGPAPQTLWGAADGPGGGPAGSSESGRVPEDAPFPYLPPPAATRRPARPRAALRAIPSHKTKLHL